MAIPITVLLGILTIISLFITAFFGAMTKKGKIPFKYHQLFAYLTVILAMIHAVLVIQKYYF